MAKALQFYNLTPAPGACPWAQRAWIALEEKKIPYDTHLVDKAAKSKEFLQLYQSVWPDPQAVAKVPTIVDTDGTQLTESAVVVEYLEQRYKGQGASLVPDDAGQAAKARLFVEVFISNFTKGRNILTAKTNAEVSDAREVFFKGVAVIDAFLKAHGSQGGDYFLGGNFSIAEVNTAPFLRNFVLWLPAHRNIDVLAQAQKAGHSRFVSWAKAVLARPSLNSTILPDEVSVERAKAFVTPIEE